jgi:prevent-host-death family protein
LNRQGARERQERPSPKPAPLEVSIRRSGLVIAISYGHNEAMLSVKIAELKNRLSHYLDHVRRGETILVQDRDRVIARIEPAGEADRPRSDDERLAELEKSGVVRRARKRLSPSWLRERPAVKADVVRAVLDERSQGR